MISVSGNIARCICLLPLARPRKQPVSDLEHLALDTRCQERFSAPCPVLDCERGSVVLLEGQEGHCQLVDRNVICDSPALPSG